MAYNDKNVLITPNKGSGTELPKIDFVSGTLSNSSTVSVNVDTIDNIAVLTFEGSQGTLLSLVDSFEGVLYSIADGNGIPVLDVLDDGTVTFNEYKGRVEILSTVSSISSTTGALTVAGGVGITGDLYVGGTINGTISGAGTAENASTATNLAGGSSGSVPYQSGAGQTTFLSVATTSGWVITSDGSNPVWTNNTALSAGSAATASSATTATNLAGGASGSVPYQSAAGQTTFLSIATTSGWVLNSDGSNPSWTNNLSINTLNVNATTSATNNTTGALVVAGGVGISGNLYVGGTINGSVTTATYAENLLYGVQNDKGAIVYQEYMGDLYNSFTFGNIGSGQSYILPSSTNLSAGTSEDYTWEFWGYRSSISSFNCAFSTPTSGQVILRISGGSWASSVGPTVLQATLDANVVAGVGKWFHYALSRQSGTSYVHINGVQYASTTTSYNFTMSGGNNRIGNYNNNSNQEWTGYLSNIRFVKGSAVYALNSTFTPSIDPLPVIPGTQLLVAQKPTLVDSSPNNFTLTGTASIASNITPFTRRDYATRYLNIGTNGKVLTSDGTYLVWSDSSLSDLATTASTVNTVLNTATTTHYLTFVNSNNATAAAENIYTTSSVYAIPSSGQLWATQLRQTGANVAIGSEAGQTSQSNSAVAIGFSAGQTNQGQNAIAIGYLAGVNTQTANSIILNASGSAQNATNSGFYVNPVRADSSTSGTSVAVYYNEVTKEFTTASVSSLSVGTAETATTATNLAGGSSGSVPYQSGAGQTTFLSVATTSGWVLTSNGTNPTWQASGNATISNDTATNASYYPVWVTSTSGNASSLKVSDSKLYFNPSSGTLNATVFNSLSDRSLKKDIAVIDNALDIVNRLSGVSFKWIENDKKSYGLIAQDLEQIIPELVDGTDKKSVNYSGVIAFLINAIKQLDQKIKQLENNK